MLVVNMVVISNSFGLENVDLDPRVDEEQMVKQNEKAYLSTRREGKTNYYLGTHLAISDHQCIVKVIHSNVNLFAWLALGMPKIDPNFLCHKLEICKDAK